MHRCLPLLLVLACPALAHADATDATWQGLTFHLGYAATPGPVAAGGPRVEVGYRVELPRVAFEVATATESVEPDDARYGDWTHSTKAIVRVEARRAFEDLTVRASAGLGYGTERTWIHDDSYGYAWTTSLQHDQAHAELRVGVELGHGPIALIDAGVRLPLDRAATEDPAWYPTFDLSVGGGLPVTSGPGNPTAAYRAEVVVADVVSAVAMWWGIFTVLDDTDCDGCDNSDLGEEALTAGVLGYAFGAPLIHAANGNGKGALYGLGYRVAASAVGALIDLAGGGDGAEGAVGGMFLGALAAPVLDYAIAAWRD